MAIINEYFNTVYYIYIHVINCIKILINNSWQLLMSILIQFITFI